MAKLLTMTVTDAEGKQIQQEKQKMTGNQLNRAAVELPELYGIALYELKKKGRVLIELSDGVQIEYKLEG